MRKELFNRTVKRCQEIMSAWPDEECIVLTKSKLNDYTNRYTIYVLSPNSKFLACNPFRKAQAQVSRPTMFATLDVLTCSNSYTVPLLKQQWFESKTDIYVPIRNYEISDIAVDKMSDWRDEAGDSNIDVIFSRIMALASFEKAEWDWTSEDNPFPFMKDLSLFVALADNIFKEFRDDWQNEIKAKNELNLHYQIAFEGKEKNSLLKKLSRFPLTEQNKPIETLLEIIAETDSERLTGCESSINQLPLYGPNVELTIDKGEEHRIFHLELDLGIMTFYTITGGNITPNQPFNTYKKAITENSIDLSKNSMKEYIEKFIN